MTTTSRPHAWALSLTSALVPLIWISTVPAFAGEGMPRLIAAAWTTVFVAAYVMWWTIWSLTVDPHRLEGLGRILWWAMLVLMATAIVTGTPSAVGFAPFLAYFPLRCLTSRREAWVSTALLCGAAVLGGLTSLNFAPAAISIGIAVFSWMGRRAWIRQQALEEQAALMAEMQTRAKISRDVHDILGRRLSAVGLQAELADRLLDSDPELARKHMAEVKLLVASALGDVRRTVVELRPGDLSSELDNARQLLGAAGINVDVVGDVTRIDEGRRGFAADVLREVVTNVLRHSKASTCRIEFTPNSFTIVDDGRGILGAEGAGLKGLRERAADAGAGLAMTSSAAGTRVEVAW